VTVRVIGEESGKMEGSWRNLFILRI